MAGRRPALTRREQRELNRACWLLSRVRYERDRHRLVDEYLQARGAGVDIVQFVADLLSPEGGLAVDRPRQRARA